MTLYLLKVAVSANEHDVSQKRLTYMIWQNWLSRAALESIRKHKLKPPMKIAVSIQTLIIGAIATCAIAFASAADLSDKDKRFLTTYEKIHSALAADDLAAAKSAAQSLGDEGNEIAKASSLKDARAGFEKLTARAKTVAADQTDYHVFHCQC
jgi:hypothetical protein